MQIFDKKLIIFIIFIFSLGFLTSGCNTPEQGGDELLGKNQEIEIINLQTNETSEKPSETSSTTNSNNNQQERLPGMKQISDFEPINAHSVTIVTSGGDIDIELFRDKAPLTTLNFLTLAKEGFYDNIIFHRVIPEFMAQVGDPQTKEAGKESMWGTGGPGYKIADEFDPSLRHDKAGVVSMANSGPNTGGSQFFITHVPTEWLDDKHAVFGQVTKGMDVVLSLTVGDSIKDIIIHP